jgi:hypothetical protein
MNELQQNGQISSENASALIQQFKKETKEKSNLNITIQETIKKNQPKQQRSSVKEGETEKANPIPSQIVKKEENQIKEQINEKVEDLGNEERGR